MQNYFWGLLRGKNAEETGDFTEAHMGEDNNFYYNEELKRWVVRGEEDKVANDEGESPPPLPVSENNETTTAPPTPSATKRGALTSDQLYTKIPGIEVVESKENVEVIPLIPLTAKSQFIPERGNDNADDYDFMN
ncbi:hypothetical protein BaOVIS_033100 [Babesia ovis]|uniref:Uncharacterized protein n=1 Tax=Babesia ovis TaxID=5869 RepID=A0A9W5TDR5_BABOV|nr:hypothetical protein BaOVIS_033100 [Babesia ovis]